MIHSINEACRCRSKHIKSVITSTRYLMMIDRFGLYHCRFLFVEHNRTFFFPLPDRVFLPCDHGLDFWNHQLI